MLDGAHAEREGEVWQEMSEGAHVERQAAATRIQSVQRGKVGRRRARAKGGEVVMRRREAAATQIQSLQRGKPW